uniref:Major facilitator superfamily protein n=1 Tax=Panagrellus redivivus TaxID=6233 RepID=A0A7E4VCY7_PANRE
MAPRYSNVVIFTGQFGLGLLHTCFSFYYVKVFLNVFKVNEYWFNVSQLLYMLWNAVNDPLFGYLQDVGGTWMKDRSKIFTWFGPPMSLAFLTLWFPWGGPDSPPWVEGLHMIVALFLYDAFFSCIGVAWGALFTESTRDHRKRVKALKYSQTAILCSVNVIMIMEKASHSLDNFGAFQNVSIMLAIVAAACFVITGYKSSDPAPTGYSRDKLLSVDDDEEAPSLSHPHSFKSVLATTKELFASRDFQVVMATNFIHTCRSTAHLNFASIATDLVIPQSVLSKGSWQLSVFFAVCTLMPQILIILNERLIVRAGAYRIIMVSFLASMMSAAMYPLSRSPYVVMFFMLIDMITVHSTAPLFNIFLAEFIEDDAVRNKRKSTLSSIVFSLNALIIKPATSIAPVIIVYLLNRSGYTIYQHDHISTPQLSNCMLRILFATPVFLGFLQFVLFRKYSLRHRVSASKLALPL